MGSIAFNLGLLLPSSTPESMQCVLGKRGAMHRLEGSSQRCLSARRKAGSCHSLTVKPSPPWNITRKRSHTYCRGPQGVQRKFLAHKPATGNSAQAERGAEASSVESGYSSSVTHQQEPAIQDAETNIKVSDKLKAAVKQVDKAAYEVTALPMHKHQDVSLAPHRHEHPGQSHVPSARQ